MSIQRLSLLLAALALVGAVTPAVAVGAGPASAPGAAAAQTDATTEPGTDANVSVSPGAQLATVLTATAISTRSAVETSAFELHLERGGDGHRAEAIAERAETLAERAEAIRADYEDATEAHEAGEISAEEYARRLATLNARAERLLDDVEALRAHARTVSALELEAAGMNRTALRAATEGLEPLTGVGASALLQRFLGESAGEIELRTDGGLRVEVEGEDGETSLEVNRERDDDQNITVAQDAALETARSALPDGNWTLERASVHPDSGYYRFEFGFRSPDRTGEAEVRVDGSSGEVFRLEVETESPDGDDEGERDDADDDHDDRELTLLLVDGTPAPNGTVTVRALADGEPVANVTVFVEEHAAAETDADGEATVRLPRAHEVAVRAGDAELRFEFDGVDDDRESVYHRLGASASLADGQVTATVSFDGEPVEGATVYANGNRVGETGADGTVAFAFDPAEEDDLELEVVKGAFEAEFEYEVRDGHLVLTEAAHEGDGDRGADGEGDEADDEEDDGHGEETDTPEDDDSSGHG